MRIAREKNQKLFLSCYSSLLAKFGGPGDSFARHEGGQSACAGCRPRLKTQTCPGRYDCGSCYDRAPAGIARGGAARAREGYLCVAPPTAPRANRRPAHAPLAVECRAGVESHIRHCTLGRQAGGVSGAGAGTLIGIVLWRFSFHRCVSSSELYFRITSTYVFRRARQRTLRVQAGHAVKPV